MRPVVLREVPPQLADVLVLAAVEPAVLLPALLEGVQGLDQPPAVDAVERGDLLGLSRSSWVWKSRRERGASGARPEVSRSNWNAGSPYTW